jgi:hypothetical protein
MKNLGNRQISLSCPSKLQPHYSTVYRDLSCSAHNQWEHAVRCHWAKAPIGPFGVFKLERYPSPGAPASIRNDSWWGSVHLQAAMKYPSQQRGRGWGDSHTAS